MGGSSLRIFVSLLLNHIGAILFLLSVNELCTSDVSQILRHVVVLFKSDLLVKIFVETSSAFRVWYFK